MDIALRAGGPFRQSNDRDAWTRP